MTNDMLIIAGIATMFIVLGAVLPFVNQEFNVDNTGTYDIDGFNEELGGEAELSTQVSSLDVLFSIGKMFFWTFGDLHWALDSFFLILRSVFLLTIARNIWVGGGG